MEVKITPDEIVGTTDSSRESLKKLRQTCRAKITTDFLRTSFEMITAGHGTNVSIFNLMKREADFELDLKGGGDKSDICINPVAKGQHFCLKDHLKKFDKTPKMNYSLKHFCRFLFRNPRMNIYIRGKQVKTENLDRLLNSNPGTYDYIYRPPWQPELEIRVGVCEYLRAQGLRGVYMYHNDLCVRHLYLCDSLIGKNAANGTCAVIDTGSVRNVTPTNEKLDYGPTTMLFQLQDWISQMVARYVAAPTAGAEAEDMVRTKYDWVRCDQCSKWRRVANHLTAPGGHWTCSQNTWDSYNSCEQDEQVCEPDDEFEISDDGDFETNEFEKADSVLSSEPFEFSRFEQIEKIGKGTFSSVFKVKDKDSTDLYALKRFKGEEHEVVKMLREEHAATTRVRHENVVFLKGWIQHPPCLVMEFIDGATLEHLLHKSPDPIGGGRMLSFCLDITKGLQAVHECGIIHQVTHAKWHVTIIVSIHHAFICILTQPHYSTEAACDSTKAACNITATAYDSTETVYDSTEAAPCSTWNS